MCGKSQRRRAKRRRVKRRTDEANRTKCKTVKCKKARISANAQLHLLYLLLAHDFNTEADLRRKKCGRRSLLTESLKKCIDNVIEKDNIKLKDIPKYVETKSKLKISTHTVRKRSTKKFYRISCSCHHT